MPHQKKQNYSEGLSAAVAFLRFEVRVSGFFSIARSGEAKNRADANSRSRFAVKVIDTTKVSEAFKHRFLPRELEILSRIEHKHIINVLRIFKVFRRSSYF